MTIKDRLKRFFLLSALGLTLGAGVAGISILSEHNNKGGNDSIVATGIGGAFSLTDQNGKTVTDKNFYGSKYMLVYFGFASCPAICPTELQKMADAYNALPKAWQDRVQPIFITVDPERDTAEVMKDFTAMFLPNMLGLRGTPEQTESVKRAYKVYAAKVPEGDSYTMDHSSFIYFMGLNGQALALFKTSDTSSFMTKRITELDGLN